MKLYSFDHRLNSRFKFNDYYDRLWQKTKIFEFANSIPGRSKRGGSFWIFAVCPQCFELLIRYSFFTTCFWSSAGAYFVFYFFFCWVVTAHISVCRNSGWRLWNPEFSHCYLKINWNIVVYAHGHRLCCNWVRHGSTTISYPQCSLTFMHERYLHRSVAYAKSAVGPPLSSLLEIRQWRF